MSRWRGTDAEAPGSTQNVSRTAAGQAGAPCGGPEVNNTRMRVSGVVLVLVVAGFSSSAAYGQTVQGSPADERAIRDLVALHASASQHDDLAGLVAGLHADADSRRADGRILSGRDEIEKRYRDTLSGGPKRMAHAHPPETIRM